MVVRVRHVAALAVAASALPFSAHAATIAPPSPTPNIGCSNGAASSINWGDGFSFGEPTVSVQNPNAVTAPLPAVQFGCSDNMYSTPLLTGSTFAVNFGVPGTTPSGDQLKWFLDTTDYKESKLGVEYDVTEFDIYAEFLKIDTGALDHKDFIGVKMDSTSGFALSDSNNIAVNGDGSVSLDPPIPGNNGFVELIPVPGAPVPEPTSFVLFGTGLLAAAQVLRRKSRI
jgi:hypothetical protein